MSTCFSIFCGGREDDDDYEDFNHHGNSSRNGAFIKPGSIASYDYQHKSQIISYEQQQKRRMQIPWVLHKTFHENYEFVGELGRGSFSVVYEACQLHPPHESYAIKVVNRRQLQSKQLQSLIQEVSILSNLNHTNIIRLHEIYKDSKYFYICMEKINGGELYDELCSIQYYTEQDCRDIFKPILTAISYCHSQKVTHRDLKPENLLLSHRSTVDGIGNNGNGNGQYSPPSERVKVADFGFAKRVERQESLTTRCGTPAYMAPEVIRHWKYDERADNWSLGVILFTLLGGYPPFYEKTTHLTFQQIVQGIYTFHPEEWDGISRDAKKLIGALLTVDYKKRITAEQALEHSWMTGRSNDDLKQRSLKSNLKQFKEYNTERKKQNEIEAIRASKSVSWYWLLTRK